MLQIIEIKLQNQKNVLRSSGDKFPGKCGALSSGLIMEQTKHTSSQQAKLEHLSFSRKSKPRTNSQEEVSTTRLREVRLIVLEEGWAILLRFLEGTFNEEECEEILREEEGVLMFRDMFRGEEYLVTFSKEVGFGMLSEVSVFDMLHRFEVSNETLFLGMFGVDLKRMHFF